MDKMSLSSEFGSGMIWLNLEDILGHMAMKPLEAGCFQSKAHQCGIERSPLASVHVARGGIVVYGTYLNILGPS